MNIRLESAPVCVYNTVIMTDNNNRNVYHNRNKQRNSYMNNIGGQNDIKRSFNHYSPYQINLAPGLLQTPPVDLGLHRFSLPLLQSGHLTSLNSTNSHNKRSGVTDHHDKETRFNSRSTANVKNRADSKSDSGSNEKTATKRRYSNNESYSSANMERQAQSSSSKQDIKETSPKKLKILTDKGETSYFKNNKYLQFDRELWSLYNRNKQTERRLLDKLQIRCMLENLFRRVYPYSTLHIVGSTLSGFAGEYSDCDMCLMISDGEVDQKGAARSVLMILKRFVCQHLREYSYVQVIFANVPILKMVHLPSGIEIDVNINNTVGIRNTKLLAWYSQIDRRVKPLVLIVKHWAKYHDINDASQQTLSSYSLELMVLHYLQAGVSPRILPNIQELYPNKFTLYTDIRHVDSREQLPSQHISVTSDNTPSLAQLFYGFIKYYTNFNYSSYGISVRTGGKISRYTFGNGRNSYIFIEEPFDHSNTARAVHMMDKYELIRRTFRKSRHILRSRKCLDDLLRPLSTRDLYDISDTDTDSDEEDDGDNDKHTSSPSRQSAHTGVTSSSNLTTIKSSSSSMSSTSISSSSSTPVSRNMLNSKSRIREAGKSTTTTIPIFDLSSDADSSVDDDHKRNRQSIWTK